jgi:ketosteroid isomerase-like protein
MSARLLFVKRSRKRNQLILLVSLMLALVVFMLGRIDLLPMWASSTESGEVLGTTSKPVHQPVQALSQLNIEATSEQVPVKPSASPLPADTLQAAVPIQSSPQETDDQTAALNQALERWSKAWRTKDVPTYLSMYAADFAPQQDMDLRTWAENRSARITGKRKIQHQIRDLQIVKEGMVATAQFTQLYADERIQMMNRKTMKWVFRDGRWWISKETSD